MRKLLQTIGELACNTQANLPPRSYINIGEDVFAVAHSRRELEHAMRHQDGYITGYAYLHNQQQS